MHPPVAPAGILARQARHQGADGAYGAWPARALRPGRGGVAARDQVVDADGSLPDIAPGMLFDGDDLGRWLQRQKQPGTRKQLSSRQQEQQARPGAA